LDIQLSWRGDAMAASAAVDLDSDVEDSSFISGLAMVMMRHHADRVEPTSLPDGRQGLKVRIDDL
jgi:hypothetical protein